MVNWNFVTIHLNKINLILITFLFFSCSREKITIVISSVENPRISFGTEKLKAELQELNYDITIDSNFSEGKAVYISTINDSSIQTLDIDISVLQEKESYLIKSSDNEVFVIGYDPSGTLYGCIDLCERIKKTGDIPDSIFIIEKPEMVLRGTAIGLQKTEILPGRKVYEYPITPENFPWFYDKGHWIKYLDMLVENRMNSLYLWNGHPFASLVKLDDYPYAVEVDEATFQKNKEMFSFITAEADKRGIWVIQMFYNIIVSQPFAVHNGIETQRRSRPIDTLLSDYTRKSIAAFIEDYPNVGLMVCLGEAMNTIEDDVAWFTETIIPGVKDGLEMLGKEEKPPIVLRGHDTDAKQVMEKALPIYPNLYTTYKYNGESLTTYEPRANWVENNLALSDLGSVHISNVHILANLEPFRYGSPDFIQKSTQAMHKLYHANGLHIYPQASYWDWPYSADKTNPRLLQIERDWIWYKAWARYAWNCSYNRQDEIVYWSQELADYYGCAPDEALNILIAYEETGEIAPKILRRFGISDGNRQTLLLGMFMSQLVNPSKWRVYPSFVESNGPKGERLQEYVERKVNGLNHQGETPEQIVNEILQHGKSAREAIDKASACVAKNIAEFHRLKNDVYCYEAIANFFAYKVKAAQNVIRYSLTDDIRDLENAVPYLEHSVREYVKLVELTKDTYLYANSMQTDMRRIPIDGTNGQMKHWEELLPLYQQELDKFKNNIEKLKQADGNQTTQHEVLMPVEVELPDNQPMVQVKNGAKVYADQNFTIKEITPELNQLKSVLLAYDAQRENGTSLRFKTDKPVKVLVGYFNGHSYKILDPPTLETNATANDRGQADIRIANAMTIEGLYPVNIYTYQYGPGEHTLELDKGIALILGFIEGDTEINTYDAGIGLEGKKPVDWLFY